MITTGTGTQKTGLGNNVLQQKVFVEELENFIRKGINFLVFWKPKIFGALVNEQTYVEACILT